jgi:alkaline phosphatase D
MGARQENWFYRQLSESNERGAKWRVIGNQLVFAHIQQQNEDGTLSFSTDSWTAYRANQNRTLKHMYENDIRNNINIAGDTHVNWVCPRLSPALLIGLEKARTWEVGNVR